MADSGDAGLGGDNPGRSGSDDNAGNDATGAGSGIQFNVLNQGQGNAAQWDVLKKAQDAAKGMTGFGHAGVTIDVSFSPTQPDNFWGYWIRPDGVVVDTRKVEDKTGFNKVMSAIAPVIIAAGAVAASGGTALGPGGAAFGAALAASTTGADGAHIALAAVVAYAGATAMSYVKDAIVNSGIASADTVANASDEEILNLGKDLSKETITQIADQTGYSEHFDSAIRAGDTSINAVTEGLGVDPTEVINAAEKYGGTAVKAGTAVAGAGAAGAEATGAGTEAPYVYPDEGGSGYDSSGTPVSDTGGTSIGSLGETTVDVGEGGTGIGSTVGDIVGNETPGSTGWYSKLASALGVSTDTLTKLGISGATTLASVLGGGDGASVSQTSTTSTLPAYVQQDAEGIWDQYINDFYGIKDRAVADEAYKKTANDTYLTESQSAWKPYQDQITQALADQKSGTGVYKPFTLSFGGKEATTFVPRPQRETADMYLKTGKEGATVGGGLAQLKNELAMKTLPGAAADTYSQKLENLMKYVTGGNKTTTGTTSVPEDDTWTKILKALQAGPSIYSSLYNK